MSHLNPRPPVAHGFVEYSRCARCGTERPVSGLRAVRAGDGYDFVCIETTWCSEQCKLTGRLEGL